MGWGRGAAALAFAVFVVAVHGERCENRTMQEICVSARDCIWTQSSSCAERRIPEQLRRDEEWVADRNGDASALACGVLFPFARFDPETRACEARGDVYCSTAHGEDECTRTRGCKWDATRTALPCAPADEPDARRVAQIQCAFDTRATSGIARWLPCSLTDAETDCADECKRKGPGCVYAQDQMPNCVPVSEKREDTPRVNANTPRDSYTPPARTPSPQAAHTWAGASNGAEAAASVGLLALSALIVLLVHRTAADSETLRRVGTKMA